MKEDVEVFYELIKEKKCYLVPIDLVPAVVDYAATQNLPVCGGMIVNSNNFQFLYTD